MNIHTALSALASLTILGACTNLEALNRQPPRTDDAFHSRLADEYYDLAQSEADQYDWYDSDYFARKGLAANNGEYPFPENIFDWDIPTEEREELLWNYNRLTDIIRNYSGYTELSEPMAKAQRYFDCWVEQAEENWQKDDIENCRTEFLRAITILENRISVPHKDSYVPSQEYHKKSTVHFGFDKASIPHSEQQKIDETASEIHKLNNYRVDIGGHADTAGPSDYNQQLSVKRAKAVKDALVERNVDTNRIRSNAFGETIPAIPTDDNIPNKQNRRVEINVHGQK